jgi:hypothetical protein
MQPPGHELRQVPQAQCIFVFVSSNSKRFIFFSQETSPNKKFSSPNDENLSLSAQGQATHTGKLSGRCIF